MYFFSLPCSQTLYKPWDIYWPLERWGVGLGKWENRRFSRASRSVAASRKKSSVERLFHWLTLSLFCFKNFFHTRAEIQKRNYDDWYPASNGFSRPDVPTGLEKPLLAEQIAGGNWHLLKSTSLESELRNVLKSRLWSVDITGKVVK